MMRPGKGEHHLHPGSSSGGPSAVAVEDNGGASPVSAGASVAAAPAPTMQSVFVQPLYALSSRAQTGLLAIVIVTTCVVAYVALVISRDSATFPVGALQAGQIAGFWVCTCAIVWYLAVVAAVVKDVLLEGEDRVVALNKCLTDEQHAQLSAAAEFALYMLLFYFCDRTTYVPRAKKKYDRDLFWSLWALLCVGGLATLRKAKPPVLRDGGLASINAVATAAAAGAGCGGGGGSAAKEKVENTKTDDVVPCKAEPPAAVVDIVPASSSSNAAALHKEPATYHVKHLQRDQTEEWKGWMQVMFLWYHYFNAKDIYNAIRLYIAAYVWMTGFGNFSYYYVRRDFSLARFCQMQWRLNFMVLLTCAVLGNEYMLYYICMLHTTFTVIIYAVLGIQSHLNVSFNGICIKFGACVAVALVVWDVDGIFDMLWAPLTWLVQYHDPYKPERPLLHEWQFRSHLDHLIWIVGMLMAFNHPRFDSCLEALDRLPAKVGNAVKCAVFAACIGGFYVYNDVVFSLPKKEYNRLHPYTSFIPIVLFIVMRNIFTTFRMYHMHLFEFLGKTTLETYIAQFHIWMATTGANGSPKFLLRILPEGWPLMNFLVMSVVFFFVSYRLFQTTNTIRTFVLPSKVSNAVLQRNLLYAAVCTFAVYLVAVGIKGYVANNTANF